MNDAEISPLDFEKNVIEIEEKIKRLKKFEADDGVNVEAEISRLKQKLDKYLKGLYTKLTPWQKTLVARHPDRPHCLDYIPA